MTDKPCILETETAAPFRSGCASFNVERGAGAIKYAAPVPENGILARRTATSAAFCLSRASSALAPSRWRDMLSFVTVFPDLEAAEQPITPELEVSMLLVAAPPV